MRSEIKHLVWLISHEQSAIHSRCNGASSLAMSASFLAFTLNRCLWCTTCGIGPESSWVPRYRVDGTVNQIHVLELSLEIGRR